MIDADWKSPELADVPKPYKRFYDDRRRHRKLYVSITTWRGTSAGAKHWYAQVRECDNPILWHGTEYYFSEDEAAKGREFGGMLETSFSTFAAALDWVIETIREHFPQHSVGSVNGGCITLPQFRQELRSVL